MFAHYCIIITLAVKFLYMYNSVSMINVDFSSTLRFLGKGSVQEEKHNCESL